MIEPSFQSYIFLKLYVYVTISMTCAIMYICYCLGVYIYLNNTFDNFIKTMSEKNS